MISQTGEFLELVFGTSTSRAMALCSENCAELLVLSYDVPAVANVDVLKCRVEVLWTATSNSETENCRVEPKRTGSSRLASRKVVDERWDVKDQMVRKLRGRQHSTGKHAVPVCYRRGKILVLARSDIALLHRPDNQGSEVALKRCKKADEQRTIDSFRAALFDAKKGLDDCSFFVPRSEEHTS